MQQLRSKIWVQAFLRACESVGGMPMVVRHGDDDAGAIFVKLLIPPNLSRVYGPRPQGMSELPLDRAFETQLGRQPVPELKADSFLKRQAEFDSDLWIVEVQATPGLVALSPWTIEGR